MKKAKVPQQLSLFSDVDFGEEPAIAKPDSKVEAHKKEEQSLLDEIVKVLPDEHYDHTTLFNRLAQSDFRSGFHLKAKDVDYIRQKGLDAIRQHAADFINTRLAPAYIPNDGKQTPMRGHPVFLAQHATGCCCRECFFKWHHILPGRQLTIKEQRYAVSVLMAWIEKEYSKR